MTGANRIKFAHDFNLYRAVLANLVDPLPHQIAAVCGKMLPRRTLLFLLADDPGAVKTTVAGLFITDLNARSNLERCLVVVPGSLVEQRQDELGQKPNRKFDIVTPSVGSLYHSGSVAIRRDNIDGLDPIKLGLGQC